tara:strand:+ start:14805 stop:16286 length:1482 start_codon:yes stop_codon:yes gene_type:complete
MKIEINELLSIIRRSESTKAKQAKYQLLYAALKGAILNESLPNQCELPATRPIASALKLSRSTVIKAYELLKLEGLLIAQVGAAHVVNFKLKEEVETLFENPTFQYISISESAEAFLGTATKLNSIDDIGVAFRPGVPPLDLFPIDKWRKLQNEYWQFVRASELSYHSGAGIELLRKTIATYLKLRRGLNCDYRQIFVVGGSLQSLYLIAKLLTNPGDEVILEDPTFPNVHSLFKGMRTKSQGIGLDEKGIDIRKLENLITPKSKLIHVTPSCHYPLGIQMPAERKLELLDLAATNGMYLIENDYEHEINFPSHDGQPLFSFDKEDRTFYLSTFNRTLHPSIRVGFVVVPKHLIDPFNALLMHSHRSISPVLQTVLHQFIEKKYLHDHMNNAAKQAQQRKLAFLQLLKRDLYKFLEVIPSDINSLQITCKLLEGKDSDKIKDLRAAGIIAHPLSKCYVKKVEQQGLIFGFSAVRPQLLNIHFQRLVNGLTDQG